MSQDPWTRGSLFALIGSAAAESGKRRPSVCDLKNGASPSPRSKWQGRTRNEEQGMSEIRLMSFPAGRRSDWKSRVAPGQADAAHGFPIVRFAAVGNDTDAAAWPPS